MPCQTCLGATLACSFGAAPATLVPSPKPVLTGHQVAANIMDHVPIANVTPFGMCLSIANPAVAAATSAAMGVLTPMPCVPATPAPWVPGSPTVMLCNAPALNDTSTLNCMWGGVITFVAPGQFTELIP